MKRIIILTLLCYTCGFILECGLRPGLVSRCPNCWEAETGEFPWMVSMHLSFSHFCAGSILNEQWILTSARCANFM
jgi:secreted trypsin-like serine protease